MTLVMALETVWRLMSEHLPENLKLMKRAEIVAEHKVTFAVQQVALHVELIYLMLGCIVGYD